MKRGIKKFELKVAIFDMFGLNSLLILVLNKLLKESIGELNFQKDD
jgi:hypothetical protein